jgi:hypothetical protein
VTSVSAYAGTRSPAAAEARPVVISDAAPELLAPPEPPCEPPRELDVLFIGNSYTIMHDLPSLVEALGEQAGVELHAEMLAMGGQDFEFHAGRQKTARVLREGDWDVVVLQSHSLDPLRNHDGFLEAGQMLVDMVRASGAVPLLFQTWPRKAGHNLYNYYDATGGNPEAMMRRVGAAYDELAQLTGAEVVEVGRAWRRVRKNAPEHDPYASDAAHPGKLGAYLTANVFFAALTDVSPVGNVEPLLGIDTEQAEALQQHAAAVVQPQCVEPISGPTDSR